MQYARSHVPILAALMVSGHVGHGDTIELPLPFPEAWPATVKYIYTGKDEINEAIGQNIIYLAGKLPMARYDAIGFTPAKLRRDSAEPLS